MPLLRINADPLDLRQHMSTAAAREDLAAEAGGSGPVIILIHGYTYAPHSERHCPHRLIFAPDSSDSWPRALGFGTGSRDEGLCIAFGWHSQGPLGLIHRRARQTSEQLADLIIRLKARCPGRPVHVVAHSLGTEIALSSLPHLPGGSVGRMVLLTGASYVSHARAMLMSPAGRSCEVLNITSRENDLFDMGFERLVRRPTPGDHALGAGLDAANALTLQIDCALSLAAMERWGPPIARGRRRICHWSSYQRAGLMDFYARALRCPDQVPLTQIRAMLPAATQPRWSGILPLLASPKSAVTLANRLRRRAVAGSHTGDPANRHPC